ncbi:DUF1134 domain-containing protein [Hyphomicrobium sp. CS1GBMeth3]|uniref:DUF1134 domain-containing protein n=1 Tax=Hyphomicrobium sp. CS1GBMeth3 TaxID=1892845 RepID=UPI0009F862FD|nr:DUF1134 domain-containing protein [Hyphomicrobium sp. CS1GBMeth3]
MTTPVRLRRWSAAAGAALVLLANSVFAPALAQDNLWSPDSYRSGSSDSGSQGGYAQQGGSYGYSGGDTSSANRGGSYDQNRSAYSGGSESYAPSRGGYRGSDAYSGGGSGGYDNNDSYSPRSSGNDGYSGGGNDAYSPPPRSYDDAYSDPGRPADDGGRGGYGDPYAPPGQEAYRDAPPPAQDDDKYYSQNEIISAGHGFFGAISQGLGKAVEYAFQSQGRPNGYILGEDAGGAFLLGLRYGEGRLFTKDAGDHKVFWQGPSVGYDAGAEGSKTMVLVYNLSDPSEIYNRFGGVQGSAYFVGGLSVQFQTYGNVTLAVIRSGVGVRLGANLGYLKYTRAPTWNPL